MKRIFKLTVFNGRLFFALAIALCGIAANGAEIGEPAPAVLSLQAVVLDMDGVTTPNTGTLWKILGQDFLRGVAPGWRDGDLQEIKWKSLADVHHWIAENRGAQLPYADYVRRREALSAYIYRELANLEPTLLETRSALKAAEVPVALASANTRFSVDAMIRRFRLERTFDAVASSEELAHDKALLGKSQTHLLACQRLGVRPSRALAVEDTSAGVEAAGRAGMIAVGLRNGYNDGEDFSSAHFTIRQLRDILALHHAVRSDAPRR